MLKRRLVGWLVKLAYGFIVFVVATILLGLALKVLVLLGAGAVLENIEEQTRTALGGINPLRISDRFLELSQPDCSAAGSLSEMARCNEIWGMLLLRAPVGLYRLVTEMISQPVVVRTVDLMTLIAGFAAAIALVFAIQPRPPGIAVPVVVIGMGLFFASLLSVFFLLFLEYGARILGEVLATSNGLPFFGGTWIGFLCGCAGKWIDDALHQRMSHVVERVFSFR